MNRLRFLRNERGESLEQIAKILNVTIQTVSNYENEKRDMSTDILKTLAEYFGCTIDFLLGKSDIRNPEELPKDFEFAFHRDDVEGLTQEEISDALKLYKEMKKRIADKK